MFVPPERLETERLVLRPYRREDEAAMIALVTDPEVMRFVGDGVMTEEQGRTVFNKIFTLYDEGAWGIWAVEERSSARLIGSAEIKPRNINADWEIVYVLHREAWGKGYATELARELVRFGFERLGLARVTATVDYENKVSLRIMEKLCMRRIAEERDEQGPYGVFAVERPG